MSKINDFATCTDCNCQVNCPPPYIARPNDFFTSELQNCIDAVVTDMIVNGTFTGSLAPWLQTTTASEDWIYSAGKALVNLLGVKSSEFIYQNITFTGGTLIFDHPALDINTRLEVDVYYGGAWHWVQTYTNCGAATEILTIPTGSYTAIGFMASHQVEGLVTVTLDNVILNVTSYQLNISNLSVINCCDNSLISYLDSSDYIIYDSYIEMKFRYSKYATSGQIKVCYDKQIVSNGNFVNGDLTDWVQSYQLGQTSGDAWVYNAGKAKMALTQVYSKMLQQKISFEKGCSYTLTFDVNYSVGDNGKLYVQTEDLSLNEVIPFDIGTKSYSLNFIAEYTGEIYLNFFIILDSYSTGNTILLDNISILNTFCSPCYELGSYDCSLLIEATNNQDSFGFYTQYQAIQRIEANFFKEKPDIKENVYRSSVGNYSNPMTNIAWCTELETFFIHKNQLKDLITILSFDNVYINKQLYVKKEGQIEIEWDKKREYGRFKCDMYLKSQFKEKVS